MLKKLIIIIPIILFLTAGVLTTVAVVFYDLGVFTFIVINCFWFVIFLIFATAHAKATKEEDEEEG